MPFYQSSRIYCVSLIIFTLLIGGGRAFAEPHNRLKQSTNVMGMLGLNTVPTARFDEVGAMRIGMGTTDPYLHSFIGLQLADPLYINIRQTSEISGLNDSADRLYPGIDFKLKLLSETDRRPAVALGMNSAFGHKRTASEYLSFSKRMHNFDFTGGVAWGQLGSAGHIKNPLSALSSHFEQRRNYNSEETQYFDDWFTGEDIGFFGGVEYFTPLRGLSLKGEYGANDYVGERSINGFNAPAPWGIGVNYQPTEWVDLSASAIGTDKLMARISLQTNAKKWIGRPYKSNDDLEIISPRPENKKIDFKTHKPFNIKAIYGSPNQISADLEISNHHNSGIEIGRSARYLANIAKPNIEIIKLNLGNHKLKGPSLKLLRQDIERASLDNISSPEEVWQNAIISEHVGKPSKDSKQIYKKPLEHISEFSFILKNKLSLTEDTTTPLYRSALVADVKKSLPFGFMLGATPRLNLADNLDHLDDVKPASFGVVRSNESDFASQRVSVDRLYVAWLHSITPDLHTSTAFGYLEEMYSGAGGEILYRPRGKTYAVGAEFWQVLKRSPYSTLSYASEEEKTNVGNINFWYEIPNTNITSFARVGRYLGKDFGTTIGLTNKFDNGVRLEGFATITDEADSNLFGGTSHLYSGVKLSMPIGNIPYVPKTSRIEFDMSPMARDAGQMLDNPIPLYELTEPLSYRQIERQWSDLLR